MWALLPLAILIFTLDTQHLKQMVTVLTENKLHLSIVASENIQDLLEEDTSNQWRRHNHISSAVRIYVRISFRVHHLVTK